MVNNLKNRINEFDDFQVVRFFEYFSQELLSGAEVSQKEIKEGIPDYIRAVTGFSEIENISSEQAKQKLDLDTSAAVTRTILLNLTDDETIAPLIAEALETYSDEELVADVVLAVGAAIALVLIAATTEFEGEAFGIKFKKGKADAEIIEAITKSFVDIISALKG
jgi:hypothetical protein